MYLAPGTDRSRESPRDVSLTNHAQTGKLTVPQDTCCEIHHATTDGRRSESICRFAEFYVSFPGIGPGKSPSLKDLERQTHPPPHPERPKSRPPHFAQTQPPTTAPPAIKSTPGARRPAPLQGRQNGPAAAKQPSHSPRHNPALGIRPVSSHCPTKFPRPFLSITCAKCRPHPPRPSPNIKAEVGPYAPTTTNMKNPNQTRTPTEAQIDANRRNAQKSTGPRTAEGKTAFGTSAQMWMNLQSKYDLAVAEDALRKQIEREVLPLSA